MRPRPDATENPPALRRRGRGHLGFNEAAARCHGKHGQHSAYLARINKLQ